MAARSFWRNKRVVLDIEFRVERHEIAVAVDDQRIDLHQARIAVQVELVERVGNSAELGDLLALQPQSERQLPALKILQTGRRMHIDANDLLG
jgi:hypothetical protein